MVISKYLARIMLRHGHAADRLLKEIEDGDHESGQLRAIAFDAADFVWATLAAKGFEKVQSERWLRNQVAEAISEVLSRGVECGAIPPEPWTEEK